MHSSSCMIAGENRSSEVEGAPVVEQTAAAGAAPVSFQRRMQQRVRPQSGEGFSYIGENRSVADGGPIAEDPELAVESQAAAAQLLTMLKLGPSHDFAGREEALRLRQLNLSLPGGTPSALQSAALSANAAAFPNVAAALTAQEKAMQVGGRDLAVAPSQALAEIPERPVDVAAELGLTAKLHQTGDLGFELRADNGMRQQPGDHGFVVADAGKTSYRSGKLG